MEQKNRIRARSWPARLPPRGQRGSVASASFRSGWGRPVYCTWLLPKSWGNAERSQVPRVSLGSGSRREGSRPLPVITFLDEPREDFRGQADPTPALGQPDRSSRWDTERLSSAGRRRAQTPGKLRNRPTKSPRQRASAYGSKYICISLAKVLLSLLKVPVTTESGKVLELKVHPELKHFTTLLLKVVKCLSSGCTLSLPTPPFSQFPRVKMCLPSL